MIFLYALWSFLGLAILVQLWRIAIAVEALGHNEQACPSCFGKGCGVCDGTGKVST